MPLTSSGVDRRIPEALSTSRGKSAGVISDVGMTDDYNSVISMVKGEPLGRFLRRIASGKFETAVGPATLRAIAVETDDAAASPPSASAAAWKRRGPRFGSEFPNSLE